METNALRKDEHQKAHEAWQPKEYKVVALRDCPMPKDMQVCDTPEAAAEYWRRHVAKHPCFNPEVETLVILMLNTRRRIKGHALIATGTLDSLLVSLLVVFRPAVICAASAILLMHNHPSGESQPSLADVNTTRDLIRAGEILKIEVVDHVIIGMGEFTSLREAGLL